MTKFILVRHGKPTFDEVEKLGFKGIGVNLAPLTEEGMLQVKETAKDEIFKNSDILISSPYTRAMQTASILANELNLDVNVEVNLHEWLPDLTNQYNSKSQLINNLVIAKEEYEDMHESANPLYHPFIEPLENVKKRAIYTLEKYYNYNQVIVVSHSVLIYMLTGKKINTGRYTAITSLDLVKHISAFLVYKNNI